MLLNKLDENTGTQLVIFRTYEDPKQTRGRFVVFNANDECIFSGATLELPNNKNQTNVSRIPASIYKGIRRKHQRFGKCIEVSPVTRRTGIFVHVGNYYSQIRGCILVGMGFKHINSDGIKDVYHSLPTMAKLYDSLQNEFEIVIFNSHN